METNLTDRYVDAVTRTVPEKQREDVAAELRASISDQIDARLETGAERRDAERAVLLELGDPDKLAADYSDRPLFLIGPRLFLTWWRLLKLLWWIVVPLAAFGIALGQTLAGAPFGAIVGTTIGGSIAVATQLAFWVTLVFALVERGDEAKAPIVEWTPDRLSETQEKSVGVGEVIAAFVWVVLGAGAMVWDLTIGFVPDSSLSFLDPHLWPWGVIYATLLLVLDAGLLVVVHLRGRWTTLLAMVRTVLTLAFTIPALLLLAQGRLINPEFFPTVIPTGGDTSGAEVGQIVAIVTGFMIAGIAVWSIIDTFRRARKR